MVECSQDRLEGVQEEAAAYVLGTLTSAERQRFQQRLDAGCPLCVAEVKANQNLFANLATASQQVSPSPSVKDRLMTRLAGESVPSGMVSIRADEGSWQPLAPGIDRKVLYMDRVSDSLTYLLRMAPGAVLPSHEHGGVEQCLIVSGSLTVESETFGPGDFQWLEERSVHSPIHSKEGCTVLIVASHPSRTRVLA